MKVRLLFLIALLSTMVWAQGPGLGGPVGPGGPPPMGMHGPRGDFSWWKNSETVSKLNLSDAQVKQLDQTYVQHKMNLIDDMAAMQKADLSLRTLLDADTPDQTQVMSAVDTVLAARGKVERETTMMMLDFRKVLTVDQWKQLRSMHHMGPGFGAHMGHGRRMGGPGPGGQPPAPQEGGPAPQSQD